MAGNQISTSVTILNSLHGYLALSLTEYSTSAAAAIAAGSIAEIAGAFFTFAGDEAIEASTWTSIVTGTTAYITLTASGTAGSQVVVAAYTSTAPTWRDDFQGWYASAASSVRVIGSVYKNATRPSYTARCRMANEISMLLIVAAWPSLSVGNAVDGSSVSASTSMTIAGNPVNFCYMSHYRWNDNIDYPIGFIIQVLMVALYI